MTRFNSLKKAVSCVAGFGLISSAALLLEAFFLENGWSTTSVFVISSLVIGALGYGIYLERRKLRDQQRQFLEDRIETMSEMNHHVRNVLGVLAFYGTQTKNIYTTRMVSDALVRMEGIMRGVLSRWGLQESYSTWLNSSPAPKPSVPAVLTKSEHSPRFRAPAGSVPLN